MLISSNLKGNECFFFLVWNKMLFPQNVRKRSVITHFLKENQQPFLDRLVFLYLSISLNFVNKEGKYTNP